MVSSLVTASHNDPYISLFSDDQGDAGVEGQKKFALFKNPLHVSSSTSGVIQHNHNDPNTTPGVYYK